MNPSSWMGWMGWVRPISAHWISGAPPASPAAVAYQIADRAAGCTADQQADDQRVEPDPSTATHRFPLRWSFASAWCRSLWLPNRLLQRHPAGIWHVGQATAIGSRYQGRFTAASEP